MEMAEVVILSTMPHRISTRNDRNINNSMDLRMATMAIITTILSLRLVGNLLPLEPAALPVALHHLFRTRMVEDNTRDRPDTIKLHLIMHHNLGMVHLLDDMTIDGVVAILIEEVIEDNIKSGSHPAHHASCLSKKLALNLTAKISSECIICANPVKYSKPKNTRKLEIKKIQTPYLLRHQVNWL
jgi:hypothetical protein